MSTPQHAGIYCRLSYAPDGSLEKVDRQETDCRDLAARLGWPVSETHVFPDNSRSAWQRGRRRPGWEALLAAIEAGEIDGIIVYHGDRLIRQPYDLEVLIGIADTRGVRIASVSGTRDIDSPDDRFILRIEAAQACRESDNTSRRVQRGWAARAAQGRPSGGGKRPFGFEPDLVTRREPECALLSEAAERLLAGQSQRGVLRWLDEQGSVTSQGKAWTAAPKTLTNLLLAPRVAGLVEREGALYEAVWPPILAPDAAPSERRERAREQWEDLKALYARSSEERPWGGRDRKYMLSGIAECPDCQPGRVYTKPSSGGKNRKTSRLYYCASCRRYGRNQEHLDAYVTGRTLAVLGDDRFLDELYAATDRPEVASEIASLERRRDETRATLEELADHPGADPALLMKSLDSFERKIQQLRDQLATTQRQRILARMAGVGRDEWDATPVDVRAETVRALWRVVLLPATWTGPGFDPASVRMERRPLA